MVSYLRARTVTNCNVRVTFINNTPKWSATCKLKNVVDSNPDKISYKMFTLWGQGHLISLGSFSISWMPNSAKHREDTGLWQAECHPGCQGLPAASASRHPQRGQGGPKEHCGLVVRSLALSAPAERYVSSACKSRNRMRSRVLTQMTCNMSPHFP